MSMAVLYYITGLHLLTIFPDKVEVLDVDGRPVQQVYQTRDRIVASWGGELSHPHWQETVTCTRKQIS